MWFILQNSWCHSLLSKAVNSFCFAIVFTIGKLMTVQKKNSKRISAICRTYYGDLFLNEKNFRLNYQFAEKLDIYKFYFEPCLPSFGFPDTPIVFVGRSQVTCLCLWILNFSFITSPIQLRLFLLINWSSPQVFRCLQELGLIEISFKILNYVHD